MNLEILVEHFGMDASPLKLDVESFPHYSNEQAIRLIFPYNVLFNIYGNILIIKLSPKGKILYFALLKIILPRVINLNHIIDKELFLFWIIKNQLYFNFPYFIIKYMIECENNDKISNFYLVE